ncbi:MAG: sce7726 family protein [Cyclobacteriaceae bacterium]
MDSYSSNQLRDYSSLFSRSSALQWVNGDFSSINFKVERYDNYWLKNKNICYLDYLKYVYKILETHYQNEYILKNTFLNKWLINKLGEVDSKIYSEFRIGSAVADLAMFNGVSKVFEIKTELDSDRRLKSQIEYYKKVFNQIYIIIPSSKVKLYSNYDSNVGIIIFDSGKDKKFELRKKAPSRLDIDSTALMQVLHTKEYKEIVRDYYGSLPEMTSFNQFKVCSEFIKKIPINKLNELFISKMKDRELCNTLSDKHYCEFNQLSLALKMNGQQRNQLFESLKSPIII